MQRALIGNYELGINFPTLPTAVRIAQAFAVTLDALVLGDLPLDDHLHDRDLLAFFVKADSLSYETKATIKSLIEGLLAKVELERLRKTV